ncbi:MAG: cupin domain-containing protein [Gemmatimonadales bacterium]|nr:cupin domain-containing protein [Gemmatimonadales bacterium]
MIHRLTVPLSVMLLVTLAGCGREGYDAAQEQEAASAEPAMMSAVRQAYPNLPSDVVFENDQVVAQRVTAEPGSWTGEHPHGESQLAVVLKGGTVKYVEGGEETERTYATGDAFMLDPTEAHDHTAMGEASIEFILITMAPSAGGGGSAQEYPNESADVMFENDRVVVQKLAFEPNVWAGEHGHAGEQLVVVIKGGTQAYREGGEETERTFTDGEVFMVEPTDAHDHAITSGEGVESVLITIK